MSDTDWTDTFADADYESEILNEFCAGLSGALGVRVFNDQDLDQDLDRYKYLSATKMITDGWCRTENGRIVIDLLRGGNRRSAGRCNGANLYLDKIPRA